MKTTFSAEILSFKTIQELPNAWDHAQYIQLLDGLDFDNPSSIAPGELKDMCMMAITDFEPNEAARIAIEQIIGERLNEGQKDNLSHEMIEEKMWEEYADLSLHEDFFNIGQLLYQSYNGKFPLPEAVQFEFKISAKKAADLEIFDTDGEVVMLRLLTQGMPPNTLLNRLYKEELQGDSFEEAQHIIWQLKKTETTNESLTYEAISSLYWFHDLKFVKEFEATLVQTA